MADMIVGPAPAPAAVAVAATTTTAAGAGRASGTVEDEMGEADEVAAALLSRGAGAGVRWVRLVTSDLHGVLRAKLIAADRLGRVLRDGQPWGVRLLHVDLAEALDPDTEYDALTHGGNCRLVPDPATFRVLPWQPDTAIVLAEPRFDDGRPAPSPRTALRAALARAAALGYRVGVGSEIEFHLYRREDDALRPVTDERAFFSARALAGAEGILAPLREGLAALGLPVSSLENEHGAGQLELNLGPLDGLEAIDAATLARASIKEIADRHGYLATFIAKPANEPETNTCGYHLHQALYDRAGDNTFWDRDAADGVSPVLRRYVAGQLAHAPALTACASPTITGYKRHQPGTFAPVRASWGFDNRGALLRVMRESGPDTRVENRLGEAAANPYLLLASQLAAGLDGLDRALDPGAPIEGDGNVDPRLPRLPRDLPEAIAALRADDILVAGLGPDIVRAYTGALASAWRRFQSYVTEWEIAEYREAL